MTSSYANNSGRGSIYCHVSAFSMATMLRIGAASISAAHLHAGMRLQLGGKRFHRPVWQDIDAAATRQRRSRSTRMVPYFRTRPRAKSSTPKTRGVSDSGSTPVRITRRTVSGLACILSSTKRTFEKFDKLC